MKAKGVLLEYELGPGVVKLQLMSDYRRAFGAHWIKHRRAVHSFLFERWYQKRSTGEESQNHHINGHIQQICTETGNSFSAVKERMKELAIDRGYPIETLPDGSAKPKSETQINTKEAGYLIDTIHQFAVEWGINLEENDCGPVR